MTASKARNDSKPLWLVVWVAVALMGLLLIHYIVATRIFCCCGIPYCVRQDTSSLGLEDDTLLPELDQDLSPEVRSERRISAPDEQLTQTTEDFVDMSQVKCSALTGCKHVPDTDKEWRQAMNARRQRAGGFRTLMLGAPRTRHADSDTRSPDTRHGDSATRSPDTDNRETQ